MTHMLSFSYEFKVVILPFWLGMYFNSFSSVPDELFVDVMVRRFCLSFVFKAPVVTIPTCTKEATSSSKVATLPETALDPVNSLSLPFWK